MMSYYCTKIQVKNLLITSKKIARFLFYFIVRSKKFFIYNLIFKAFKLRHFKMINCQCSTKRLKLFFYEVYETYSH